MTVIKPTVTDEMIEQGKKGVAARLRWASIHWGAEGLHSDAIPHIARAALEAAAPLIAAQALRDAADGYQSGGWADDLPAGSSRPALILGMSQRAVAWLRARADKIAGADS